MRTEVVFHYGEKRFGGTVVRSDREDPGETIIRLDDGRHVRAVECQYRLPYAAGGPHDPHKGEAPTMDAEAVLAAANAYRAAQKAERDHFASGRASWMNHRQPKGTVDPVARDWRRRRLELTEDVSRTRIALLEAARA